MPVPSHSMPDVTKRSIKPPMAARGVEVEPILRLQVGDRDKVASKSPTLPSGSVRLAWIRQALQRTDKAVSGPSHSLRLLR